MRCSRLFTVWILLISAVSTSQEEETIEKNSDDDYREHDHTLLDVDEIDGQAIVEGDILLPQGAMVNDWDVVTPRTMITVNFWKNGIIYYQFDDSVDEDFKAMIYMAMKQWETPSCLQFKECENNDTCITITSKVNSCSSYVGNLPGGQKLYLGKGCRKVRIVSHEIGHAVGFFHEQGRKDRDEYIRINANNVKPEKYKQFVKIMKDWGTEYDYASIMHYHSTAFSTDHINKNSMSSYNPHYQTLMGRSEDLSYRDKYRVNKMYSCSNKCPNSDMKCLNGGYLSPYKNLEEECHCICPPRIKGKLCGKKPTNYEYYDVPICSKNITKPTTIETPGYPRRNRPPEKCSFWIQAPEGKKVTVEFEDFSFSPRYNGTSGKLLCYYERVEIRYKDFHDGEMHCGEDLKDKKLTSDSNYFLIIINIEEKANGRRGLKAKVTFI